MIKTGRGTSWSTAQLMLLKKNHQISSMSIMNLLRTIDFRQPDRRHPSRLNRR